THAAAHLACRSETGDGRRLKRAWTDKDHVASQDREQLRDLVKPYASYEPCQEGFPVLVGQKPSSGIAPIVHGPELDEPERPSVEAGPYLPKQDWASERAPDNGCGQRRRHGG